MALLRYGKQIIGLSRSQQQLGFGRYLTTKSHHRCLGATDTSIFISDNNNNNKELELPPKTPLSFKSFFTNLFKKIASLGRPTPREELLWKIMDLAEKSKSYPEEHPPLVEFRPLLHELLGKMPDIVFVKLLYELARPAASPSSPPPIVLDDRVKDFVDKLPTNIIHIFQDMTVYWTEVRYQHILVYIRVSMGPRSVDVTADVSDIGKEHLKVFVVGDLLLVTGTDKAFPHAHVCTATPKQMVKIPQFPYLHNKVTASIWRNQLKIVFPCLDLSAEVNVPTVFQINVNYRGSPWG